MNRLIVRSLLGVGHSHGGREIVDDHEDHSELDHNHALEEGNHESTLDLRIAAIFVILCGAVLMGLPTVVLKQFQDPDAVVPRLLRAFAGGVIIALALVHIIPEAVGELNSLIDFPIGGCAILFGIVALVLIDSSLAAWLAPKQHINSSHADAKAGSSEGHCHDHSGHKKAHPPHGHPAKEAAAADAELAVPVAGSPAHQHQCMRSLSASTWLASGSAPMRDVRQYVTAYTMELGCIFHSIVIGVGVGVITEGRELVITLMVALAIHQGLEALALGSVLALTSFHAVKKIIMLLMYSITTPIGIAIGIAIASSYSPDSVTSRAVQGTLNGVSGGMLLYIGMYQLIAEEFSREDMLVKHKLRYGMYAALLLGCAAMCIIGIWA